MWRHTKRGDKYVTVNIDLTPVRDGRKPARLLDMVPGRSRKALKERDQAWCQGIEVVTMDGSTGFQDRRRPGAAQCQDRHGPLPRRGPDRRQAR